MSSLQPVTRRLPYAVLGLLCFLVLHMLFLRDSQGIAAQAWDAAQQHQQLGGNTSVKYVQLIYVSK